MGSSIADFFFFFGTPGGGQRHWLHLDIDMLISNIVMSKVITKIIDDCQIDRRPKKIKSHEDKSVMKKVRKMLGEGACIYIYTIDWTQV